MTGIRLFAGAAKWATIAPNDANGKDAVAALQTVLTKHNPKVEFAGWPS
ncbi:MAG: hypothetical protein ACR2PI_04595 [Hyphomicrobiaceae bacterium]